LEAPKTNSQGNTEQKEQRWRYYNNTQLQTTVKAIATKTAWYWQKTDMNPCSYAHMIFDKAPKRQSLQ
jgi:hypothetical protein